MNAKVNVLSVLDRLIGNARTTAGLTGDPRMRDNLRDGEQARAAVAELIEADEEYDAAVTAHQDLVRRIAEQGWYEIQTDALRNAGVRTDRAQARRAAALAGVGGAK